MEFKTAKTLKDEKSPTITTDITPLDKCLRGGIRPGKVYELVGKPGTGKTQLWQVTTNALFKTCTKQSIF